MRLIVQGSSSLYSNMMQPNKIPQHVAIIMDGNGRWAKRRLLPRIEGHRAGAKTVRMVVEESRRLGVRYLTLFAFSSENWGRPAEEVSLLMKLFAEHLESELELMLSNDIRLRAAGDLERLPKPVRESLERSQQRTAKAQGMDLILAVSYGGRDEILHAARSFAHKVSVGQAEPHELDEKAFRANFYLPDVPDVDLLIRTSAEYRISNFLLWQIAYSEIVVSQLHWPEFSREEYNACIEEFANRERRFGLTGDQLA